MYYIFYRILRKVRSIYIRVFKPASWFGHNSNPEVDFTGQKASDLLKSHLQSNEPTMICRFGGTELLAVLNYLHQQKTLSNLIDYIKGKNLSIRWEKNIMEEMINYSGFFPSDHLHLEAFALLMLEDMKQVDVLASWNKEERFFAKELAQVPKIKLHDLNAFIHEDPWSEALANKHVVVVHPFVKSIRHQYGKRELLFSDQRVLPSFILTTIKAVQTLRGENTRFKNWFEALDHMKLQLANIDFDIALIGCGAYGFPLAAYVKRMGKKAVHLGGALQLLFGIKGRRWEVEYDFEKTVYNDHWERPLEEETPKDHLKIDHGAYW